MRAILAISALAILAANTAAAQTTPPAPPPPKDQEKPVDLGPNTPGANNAYNGGGVVLQGAPGAPPPAPAPTPPGQAPANAAPPR